MLIIAYQHASVVSVILYYYMLQNEAFIIQYNVSGCVNCISNKGGYFHKEESYKHSTKEVILSF